MDPCPQEPRQGNNTEAMQTKAVRLMDAIRDRNLSGGKTIVTISQFCIVEQSFVVSETDCERFHKTTHKPGNARTSRTLERRVRIYLTCFLLPGLLPDQSNLLREYPILASMLAARLCRQCCTPFLTRTSTFAFLNVM